MDERHWWIGLLKRQESACEQLLRWLCFVQILDLSGCNYINRDTLVSQVSVSIFHQIYPFSWTLAVCHRPALPVCFDVPCLFGEASVYIAEAKGTLLEAFLLFSDKWNHISQTWTLGIFVNWNVWKKGGFGLIWLIVEN